MASKKLLIIDSNAVIHRAFHALPPLKTTKGEIVNAIYGFCLILFKALKDIQPDFVCACFDVKAPTLKHAMSPLYKAKRKKAPDELYSQIDGVKKILDAFGIPVFEKPGFEADDLIGTIVLQAKRKQVKPKIENIILTGDMDALQLVDKQTKVLAMRKGIKDTVLYNEQAVQEKYSGLKPAQLQDYRALRGDPSDNIPGVTGIGEKTAVGLLSEFNTLEKLYKAIKENSANIKTIKPSVLEKLKQYQEQALISKQLAEINQQAGIVFDLKEAMFGQFSKEKAAQALKDFEFFTLIGKMPGHLQENGIVQGAMFSSAKQEESPEQKIERLEKQGVFSKKVVLLEKALIPIVEQMQKNGIKVDLKHLSILSKQIEVKILALERLIYKGAGSQFNINSPQQISEVLFSKLGVSVDKVRKTPTGALSTNARELEKLKNAHPIVSFILQYREFFKLKTGFVDALPRMISPKTGRVHPKFHQLGTETGRMSCSDPNLQNIPVKGELGTEIRKCFIAENGYEFVSCDYSQMELRVAASLACDKKMLQSFKRGDDIHTVTASEIFEVPQDKITKEQRDLAKTLNFGVLYGMGPVSFAERTGLSRKQSKEFIDKYFQEFFGLKAYIEQVKGNARERGFVETKLGRKRFLQEIDSRDPRIRAQAERMAVNLPLQGYAADIMKMAMVALNNQLSMVNNSEFKLLLQIHDELLFEVKQEKAKAIALKTKAIMENVVDVGIPLKVDVSIGANWGSLKNI